MTVLVAYASRHGATRGIAERLTRILRDRSIDVDLRPIDQVDDVAAYDAFILGSAAFTNHWMKEATTFVRRNRAVLGERPVWLFSSGPVGTEKVDSKGNDVLKKAEPREFSEFASLIHPREEHVFFGAWDPEGNPVGLAETLFARFAPKLKDSLPAGDFRDWPAIEAWANAIGDQLERRAPVPA
jgi:menaquinone-dependent protoporphyrinogen oxidase